MNDRLPRSTDAPPPMESLTDGAFIASALVMAFRLFISLVGKRWPDIRGIR